MRRRNIGGQIGLAWIEGRPQTVRVFGSWLQREWVVWWLGIKTWWPKGPLSARRVCAIWPLPDTDSVRTNCAHIARLYDS